MKCEPCNGTGEIASQPYREAAPMKQEEKPKKPSLWKRINWETVMGWGIVLSIIAGLLAGFVALILYIDKRDVAIRQKRGNILVQYDDKGTPTRCWIAKGQDPYVKVSDHYAIMYCENRYVAEDNCMTRAAHELGVDDFKGCQNVGIVQK